jgi:hypothetical protein
MKFAKYSIKGQDEKKPAFTSVILASFGKDDRGATYNIQTTFDPALFSNSQPVELSVPNEFTTRSVLSLPSTDIFNGRVLEEDQAPTEDIPANGLPADEGAQ